MPFPNRADGVAGCTAVSLFGQCCNLEFIRLYKILHQDSYVNMRSGRVLHDPGRQNPCEFIHAEEDRQARPHLPTMTVPSTWPRLIDDIRRQFPAAALVTPESVDTATVNGGAYLLLMDLPVRIDFSRGTLCGTFEPGFYVYAGSAYGPGGLRARIRRHMRAGKPSHWHVDALTAAAHRICAIPVEHGNECAVAEVMLGTRLFRPSLPGFGSSDCNRCISHLLEPIP